MPNFVQRIDFVLSIAQIAKMCTQRADTNGIRITFGINEQAEIMLSSEGVFWDGNNMEPTSDPFPPCPIPPDCPGQPYNITGLPTSVNAGKFFNLEATKAYFNR